MNISDLDYLEIAEQTNVKGGDTSAAGAGAGTASGSNPSSNANASASSFEDPFFGYRSSSAYGSASGYSYRYF
jgi:hypothetical protein